MISSFFNYIVGYNETNTDNNNKIDTLNYNSIKLPYELVNIILDYDGRIKYKYKPKNAIDYHKYVNVIHKHDERYSLVSPVLDKKRHIMKDTETRPNDTSFYFEFAFDNQPNLILCYDYNWSYNNIF